MGDINSALSLKLSTNLRLKKKKQGHFRPFSKLENSSKFVHDKPEIHSIVLSCECGNPDTIEDVIGGDWKSGRKTCSTWGYILTVPLFEIH